MPTTSKRGTAASRVSIPDRIDFDAFLARLSPKDRLNVERHLAAVGDDADGRHAALWQRVACAMMSLAGHSAKLNGQQSAQFYVADGKYRMQVFAMEDLRDGKITLYCGDTLEQGIKQGIVAKPAGKTKPSLDEASAAVAMPIPGNSHTLNVEQLDGRTPNPAPFYKDMLGWNRRALRISLPVDASNAEAEAAEALCALSAANWRANPAIAK